MATEFATFPLAEGKNSFLGSEEGAEVLQSLANTLYQQTGCQKVAWATAIEQPELFTLTIDWDSVDHHVAMQQNPLYEGFMKKAASFLDLQAGSIVHAHLSPFPPTAALEGSPVTEYITMYFPVDYSEADRKKTEEDMHKLFAIFKMHKSGSRASAAGWVVEKEVAIPGSEEKGCAFIGVLGWDSVEAHMEFRETQAFKESIDLLRKAKDLKKTSMVHLSLQHVTKSG